MKTSEFLADLRSRNIRLWSEGDKLRCSAPQGVLTTEIRAGLTARKTEILSILRFSRPESFGAGPALEPITRTGDMHLSFGQERLWFLHQLNPGDAAYHIVAQIRFTRTLDVPVLERTLAEVVRRHETLRTTFDSLDGRPIVHVHPPQPIELTRFDLRDRLEPDRSRARERIQQEESSRPFDLGSGPLMRLTLIQTEPAQWDLLVVQHHIISDRWSLGIFIRELTTLYRDFEQGQSPSLGEPRIQYVDFAQWQRTRMQGGLLGEHLTFWRKLLAGQLPILNLPTDRPRSPEQTHCGAWETRTLSSAGSRGVRQLSGSAAATPFMIFLAAFDALLHRYTGQDDILVGSPIAGRDNSLVEGLIGCFVNMLVFRTDLTGNPTFRTLVSRVRDVAVGVYSHAELPFEMLVADLRPPRDLSRSPFFQVALALQTAPKSVEMTEDITSAASGGTLFDLTLFIVEHNDHFSVTAEYNVDLFDRETIARMLGHFEVLIAAATGDPDRPIQELPLLSPHEQVDAVRTWNSTGMDVGPSSTIVELIEAQVGSTPDAIATTFENESITYRDLNARANQLAHYLRDAGVGPETLVGICMERSPRMLVALLGVLKAGGAYVPLDPSHPIDRLSFMMKDSRLSILLTEADLRDRFSASDRLTLCLDSDWPAVAAAQSAENPRSSVTGEAIAYVIYTSGSTGTPKGVQVRHRSLVNFIAAMRREIDISADDALLSVTTLSFDIAGLELYLPLTVGARVAIVPRDATTDGRALADALIAARATMMQATPATWRLLLEAGWSGGAGFKVLCGGEACPRDLANRLADCGRAWNLYGPTETTIWSSVEPIVGSDAPLSIGRPIGNTDIYLLDSSLQPVPIGVTGELFIGGEGLARGYWKRPELTAERFVPHPFASTPGLRLYRTGDLAKYLPDGRIEWIARVDHQVKVRGFRIELGEIETVLTSHESVKEAVVFADGDADNKRLVAYVVFRPGESLTASEMRQFAKQSLPVYMVPSFFVKLDLIPLTPNRKVDRRALPNPFDQSGRPEAARVAPRTAAEQRIAAIWHAVLGTNSFSIYDNFFDVGGHSLLSMRVIAEIENAFGRRLNPRVMFLENLEQIAQRCGAAAGEQAVRARSGDRAAVVRGR